MKKKLKPTLSPNNIAKGRRLNYNAADQAEYVRELKILVKRMVKITKREIISFFEGRTAKTFFIKQEQAAAMDESVASQARILTNHLINRLEQIFNLKAPKLAKKMVKKSARTSASALGSSLKQLSGGLTLKTNFVTAGMKEVVKATISENVSLIKSIAADYLGDVQKAVMRSITTGDGLENLVPAIEKFEGISYRKAKNIALDQTRKTFNNINKQRMQTIGVKKFEWVHSGGGDKPRKDHIEMSGNIYSFDDLPIIDQKTGERGIPGQAINCRCTMIPVTEYEEGNK